MSQRLESGQILDLQVIQTYIAVLDGLAIELVEKILEDVTDAYACEEVALLNGAVQTVWNEALVAKDREKRVERLKLQHNILLMFNQHVNTHSSKVT